MADISSPKSKLFALLIGIDDYKDKTRNLSGAVNDAKRVKDFLLKQQPPVDENRIIFLTNSDATASTIIQCLQYLSLDPKDNPRGSARVEIDAVSGKDKPEKDDPILIFYAGHGSQLPLPTEWTSENTQIQCLSPHDACIGEDRSVINVIPDRTFGALLQQLADAKGNNITVILDCCHSGSGTRDDAAVPRGMEFKEGGTALTINESYQRELWINYRRGIAYLPKFANAGLTSHVVLAACGPDENAYEDPIKHEGRFTSAFLSILETAGTDTLTYADLIKRLDYLPSQTPRCEGRDKDVRILFDAGLKQRDRTCFGIEINDRSTSIQAQYVIGAGQVHGIGKDDIFAVYKDHDTFTSGGDPLGSLVVKAITSASSFVSTTDSAALDVPNLSAAAAVLSQVKSPDAFRVNVSVDKTLYPDLLERVLKATEQAVQESAESANTSSSSDTSAPRVATASANKANISVISLAPNAVTFKFQDGIVHETLGLERLSGFITGNESTLISALRSAAHFFRHLGSSPARFPTVSVPNSTSPILLRDYVDVRICELKGSIGLSDQGVLQTQLRPIPGGAVDAKLCGMFKPKLSYVNDLDPTQVLYGVDVLNRTGLGLYVWLFYFDCSTLQIINFYSPPTVAGKGEAPLPPLMKTPKPLNYGDAGGIPLAFEVPEGQTVDGGFLRIFLSTHHIDLSGVAQPAVVRPGQSMSLVQMKNLMPVADLWDAITIPIKLG